jgi:hypothetical protein
MQLAFGAIKSELRRRIEEEPDRLSWALKRGQKIEHIVLILARDIAVDQLESGEHMIIGTQKTMIGDGLVSLFDFLTFRFEQEGIETPEQTTEAKTELDKLIKERVRVERESRRKEREEQRHESEEIQALLDAVAMGEGPETPEKRLLALQVLLDKIREWKKKWDRQE